MFPVDQLTHFQATNANYKLVKPWWDVFTDYLATALLVFAILSGAMQATQTGSLVCLPVVECDLSLNQSLLEINSFCAGQSTNNLTSTSEKTPRMKTIMVKMQDRRHYDFVETECGRIEVHWFTSYFPLIVFLQAMVLIIVDNFWLKLPESSSIIDHFVSLVVECHNTPGTCLAVSNVLWDTNISESNRVKRESRLNRNHDFEQTIDIRQPLVNGSFQAESSPLPERSNNNNVSVSSSTASLDVSEAVKAKALHEKVSQLRKDVEENHFIYWIYFVQAITQSACSFAFLVFNNCYYEQLSNNVNFECRIGGVINEDYSYFKCTNGLVPYFQITHVISSMLTLPVYFILCICICVWSFRKKDKEYDFKKDLLSERKGGKATKQDYIDFNLLSDIAPAKGDLGFLLYLLNMYNKLYSLRFSVFLSEKNEKKLKDHILMSEWPVERLKDISEDGGRTLRLANLTGIPKTVFQMTDLDFLRLENCNVEEYFDCDDWEKLHLRSLSLINCGLTIIPPVILQMDFLETLDLSYNNIVSIPVEIGNLTSLRALDLSHNNITEGVDLIIAMERLTELKLRGNNSLQLRLRPGQPINLMRLEVSGEIIQKMDDETFQLLNEIVFTEVLSDRDSFVIKYSPVKAPTHIENMRKNSPERIYKMTSKPKGVALIINISSFYGDWRNNLPERYGSEADVRKLEKLFKDIGYHVEVVPQDLVWTEKVFEGELSRYLGKYDHCDSVILTMMSHGSEEGLHLGSGEIITVERIVSLLQTDNLQDKPKLIFLQYCRGTKIMPSRTLEVKSPKSWPTACVQQSDGVATDAMSDEPALEVSLPAYSDTLIAYSTLPGYVSWRSTQHGSWFIRALVDVFSKYAWEEDVLSLLTYVNYEVSRKLTTRGYKQVPAPQSTLMKKLYFLPGYFEEDEASNQNNQ